MGVRSGFLSDYAKRITKKEISMGTKSIEKLLDDLNNPYCEPRHQAAIALREIPDPRAIKPLIRAVARFVRPTQCGEVDLAIIGRMDAVNQDRTLIEKYFSNEQSPLDKTDGTFLGARLEESEHDSAITSLTEIIKSLGIASLDPLLDVLTSNSDWAEQMIFASVIRNINDVRAVKSRAFEQFYNLLQRTLEADFRNATKENFINLLGLSRRGTNVSSNICEIKTIREGIPQIIRSLLWMSESATEQFLDYLGSGDVYARIGAAIILGILKEVQAFKQLTAFLQSDTEPVEIKVAAIDALGLIDASLAIDLLVRVLQENKDEAVKKAVIKTLRVISRPDAILPIIACLRTEHPDIQEQAVKALESITGKRFLFGSKNADNWERWWTANKGKVGIK